MWVCACVGVACMCIGVACGVCEGVRVCGGGARAAIAARRTGRVHGLYVGRTLKHVLAHRPPPPLAPAS